MNSVSTPRLALGARKEDMSCCRYSRSVSVYRYSRLVSGVVGICSCIGILIGVDWCLDRCRVRDLERCAIVGLQDLLLWGCRIDLLSTLSQVSDGYRGYM